MIYFYNMKLYSGGAETLIYRMLVELKKRKIPSCVVCETCSDTIRETMENADVDINYDTRFYKHVKKNDVVVVFSLKDLIKFQIRLLYKRANVILYIVGLYTLTLQRLKNHKVLLKLIKPIMSCYLERAIRNDHLIFMDSLSVGRTECFYKKSFNIPRESLFPLPIDIEDLPTDFYKDRLQRDTFIILSIARADFPFKGYLKGLIEECTILSKEFPIELMIVSYGEGINELKSWINNARREGFHAIKLIGEKSYEDLGTYINCSNLYVGMGTTVLDAAKRGVVSIAVQSHTYKLKSNNLFHNNPYLIGEDPEHNLNNAADLIRTVIYMTDEEYKNAMIESACVVKKIYSKEIFMDRFMKLIDSNRK